MGLRKSSFALARGFPSAQASQGEAGAVTSVEPSAPSSRGCYPSHHMAGIPSSGAFLYTVKYKILFTSAGEWSGALPYDVISLPALYRHTLTFPDHREGGRCLSLWAFFHLLLLFPVVQQCGCIANTHIYTLAYVVVANAIYLSSKCLPLFLSAYLFVCLFVRLSFHVTIITKNWMLSSEECYCPMRGI